MNGTPIQVHVPTLETAMAAHALQLGKDLVGYRNHAYRVLNLCIALQPSSTEALERLAIVAAYHDLGVWTEQDVRLFGAVGSSGGCSST